MRLQVLFIRARLTKFFGTNVTLNEIKSWSFIVKSFYAQYFLLCTAFLSCEQEYLLKRWSYETWEGEGNLWILTTLHIRLLRKGSITMRAKKMIWLISILIVLCFSYHLNGLLPVCNIMCRFKSILWEYFLSHWLQLKGFSPEWVL